MIGAGVVSRKRFCEFHEGLGAPRSMEDFIHFASSSDATLAHFGGHPGEIEIGPDVIVTAGLGNEAGDGIHVKVYSRKRVDAALAEALLRLDAEKGDGEDLFSRCADALRDCEISVHALKVKKSIAA